MVLIFSNEPQIAQLLQLALLAQGGASFIAGLNAGVDDVLRKPFTLETGRRQICLLYTLAQQRTLAIATPVGQTDF